MIQGLEDSLATGAVPARHQARAWALGMSLCLVCGTTLAQEITKVYPRWAVAGQEVQFTAEGKRLPVARGGNSSLKHAFAKPAQCVSGKNDKPATRTRYSFSCRFKPGVTAARLSILGSKKARTSNALWEGEIQVLPAPPVVEAVALMAGQPSGQTRVLCNALKVCTTIVGDLRAGQPTLIEISGSNLPVTLTLSFAGCRKSVSSDDVKNTSTRSFTCQLRDDGNQALRVLGAPVLDGGKELFSEHLAIAAQTQPAAQTP